jgi:hypothetical protein
MTTGTTGKTTAQRYIDGQTARGLLRGLVVTMRQDMLAALERGDGDAAQRIEHSQAVVEQALKLMVGE